MKIAYIGPTGIYGGVRIIAEHLNRLTERGHDCTLIGTGNEPLTWLECRFAQRPLKDPGGGYDVVVGTAVPTWPIAADMAGAGRAFGLLQMADWLFEPKGSEGQTKALETFAQTRIEVLAISEWLAQLSETAGHTTHRIRNGIDTRLFFPQQFPDIPPFDGLTVVTEGYSRNPAKDVDNYVYRAIRRLKWDDGRKIRALGFSQFPPEFEFDNFWQAPQQNIIRMIYSAGDIFLKATRYEGRPGPDMEAMACGAVVCRAIGTGDDDLKDDYNCLKVSYGDYDGFLANARRLLDDVDLRVRLREAALEYVKTRYDWPGAIDLVEQALTGAVTRPDPTKLYQYDLAEYNALQRTIVEWETPQAMWLGETLADLLQPESVIDIGCGPGIYLTPFKPAARVLGVDGAPEAGKALEPGEFVRADFREDWRPLLPEDGPEEGFDLALCIETGEHLPPDRADYLVDLLTTCADTVFWSAAQPGQGGHLHLNEQPREWWLDKFKARGFDLHPKHGKLAAMIAENPHCKRVQWLIGNSMLLGRVGNANLDHDANGRQP